MHHRRRARGLAALASAFLGLLVIGADAHAQTVYEPPFETTTAVISIEFPAELVSLRLDVTNAAGPRPDNPGGHTAGRAAGCEGLPNSSPNVPVKVAAGTPMADTGLEASDPGTYSITSSFVGYCGFIDDDDRYDAAVARYPVGSTVPVTVTLEIYAPASTNADTFTFMGDVPVIDEWEPGYPHATLGEFVIDESSGSVLGAAAGTAEATASATPMGFTAAADDGGGFDPASPVVLIGTAGLALPLALWAWFRWLGKGPRPEAGTKGLRG